MKRLILVALTLITWSTLTFATEQEQHVWQNYSQLLKETVKPLTFKANGNQFFHNGVDYTRLATQSKALIAAQQDVLAATVIPSEHAEKLAFLINAYNFFTLAEIQYYYQRVGRLPRSMKTVGWKKKHHTINGRNYSLDSIEHKQLRKMHEPRIHFAINCASVGCPSLHASIYESDRLDAMLTQSVTNALKNPLHLRRGQSSSLFSAKKPILSTTKLFSWFGADFRIEPYDSIVGFIHTFAPKRFHALKSYSANISYDWALNTPAAVTEKIIDLGATRHSTAN